VLELVTSIPWPFYPAIIAAAVALVLFVMASQNVDYQKWEHLKATSSGHPLAGRNGAKILTERGMRLFGWFFVAGGVSVVCLFVGYAVCSYLKI
jgi:Na+/H+ antiporter NhaC